MTAVSVESTRDQPVAPVAFNKLQGCCKRRRSACKYQA